MRQAWDDGAPDDKVAPSPPRSDDNGRDDTEEGGSCAALGRSPPLSRSWRCSPSAPGFSHPPPLPGRWSSRRPPPAPRRPRSPRWMTPSSTPTPSWWKGSRVSAAPSSSWAPTAPSTAPSTIRRRRRGRARHSACPTVRRRSPGWRPSRTTARGLSIPSPCAYWDPRASTAGAPRRKRPAGSPEAPNRTRSSASACRARPARSIGRALTHCPTASGRASSTMSLLPAVDTPLERARPTPMRPLTSAITPQR